MVVPPGEATVGAVVGAVVVGMGVVGLVTVQGLQPEVIGSFLVN